MPHYTYMSPAVILYKQAIPTIYNNTGASITPDNKVHGANMGPIWGRQDPGGPHVGPMNFVIWDNMFLMIANLSDSNKKVRCRGLIPTKK